MYITPAILPKSFDELVTKLDLLQGLTGRVQIDLCDGIIGKERTWMPVEGSRLPEGFEYEFDLMVKEWKTPLLCLVEAGVKRFVMHMDTFSIGISQISCHPICRREKEKELGSVG
jgi:hypothetical protein